MIVAISVLFFTLLKIFLALDHHKQAMAYSIYLYIFVFLCVHEDLEPCKSIKWNKYIDNSI